ncbi:L10-interacting MYB domain-containing protein-like [Impatiens glandulifera]|uniref:L10-interacting MYB domain-containing protein-like n=1 Tax=Impatiens glandulifera TaxID=253017 RepID=UPI001FB0BB4E|nr:L10-interacting MYB domain-containing protein-like [Impatiens glandulifera]
MADNMQRANWKDPKLLKLYFDACIEEDRSGNKNGNVFKKRYWDIISNSIKEKKGLILSQKQLKNQWDYLKKKYGIWEKIINKTGNGYDPITNTVGWTSEEWEEYIKVHPDAKQFRYVGLQYADEMNALFDGIGATGKDAWGPSMEGQPSCPPKNTTIVDVDLDIEIPSSSVSPANIELSKHKRRRTNKEEIIDDHILEVLKNLKESDQPNLEECLKVLDDMFDVNDPLYSIAGAIFCDNKANREWWMLLSKKTFEARKQWLLVVGKKMGLI